MACLTARACHVTGERQTEDPDQKRRIRRTRNQGSGKACVNRNIEYVRTGRRQTAAERWKISVDVISVDVISVDAVEQACEPEQYACIAQQKHWPLQTLVI